MNAVMLNAITLSAFRDAARHDKKLEKKDFDWIFSGIRGAYYDLIIEAAQSFWPRLARLWHINHPDCVTADGLVNGYIDCDNCSDMLFEMLDHFVYDWWIPHHPELQLSEFDEGEARSVIAGLRAAEEAERLEKVDYQMALF